ASGNASLNTENAIRVLQGACGPVERARRHIANVAKRMVLGAGGGGDDSPGQQGIGKKTGASSS
ncbi:unnamed protein product, partial [Amoebophrya sp. A25]